MIAVLINVAHTSKYFKTTILVAPRAIQRTSKLIMTSSSFLVAKLLYNSLSQSVSILAKCDFLVCYLRQASYLIWISTPYRRASCILLTWSVGLTVMLKRT